MEHNEQSPEQPAESPPYVIEGARSSTSKCKTCRRKIVKGTLRLGILVEGFYGPGYMWHHLECAARRQIDKVEEAYAEEAWKAARVPPPEVPALESLVALKEKAEEKRRQRRELPYIEVDPSGRAKCKRCAEPIEKGTLRVLLAREVRFGGQARLGPMAVHSKCVTSAIREDDEVVTELESLPGALRENSAGVSPEEMEQVIAIILETSQP